MPETPDPIPFPRAAGLDAVPPPKGGKETRALGQVLGEIIQRLDRIERQHETRDPELAEAIKRIEGFLYIDMRRAVEDAEPARPRRRPLFAAMAIAATIVATVAFLPSGTFGDIDQRVTTSARIAADRLSAAWSLNPDSNSIGLIRSSEAELVRR